MEQIEQLLELLKQTPEMALYGITIYFLFILLKLASWVYALQKTLQLGINRWSEYKSKKLDIDKDKLNVDSKDKELELSMKEKELEFSKLKFDNSMALRIAKHFKNAKISNVDETNLLLLLEEIKSTTYIHESDISKALKTLREAKK